MLSFALLSCSPTPPCPIDLNDAGCLPPTAECADAVEDQPCATFGTSCQQCVSGTYHSYVLSCSTRSNGGLLWVLGTGIPPPGCVGE